MAQMIIAFIVGIMLGMNDIEKAIEVLKEQIIKNAKTLETLPNKAKERATDLRDIIKACQIAISALEKQIPYQPSEIDCVNEENNILDGYCKCNKLVDSRMKYCRLCGQKLDWSEVE